MDQEVRVKVTRLRRRVSIEQSDDGKSSSVSGTPVKKKGRKIVKPELELIDENETNSKKSTKKADAEEKPVTPARRSARIRSNTSIISDTIINIDSPRAKRAARRTSQAGSDTDMPLTPARLTRRTRKDSASSIEKEPASAAIKATSKNPKVILEEPESIIKHDNDNKTSDSESNKQSPIRKSPRLLNKISKLNNTSVAVLNEEKSNGLDDNGAVTTVQSNESQSTDLLITISENKNNQSVNTDNENTNKKDLSISSTNLLMSLETHPKKLFSHINKSLTEAQKLNKIEPKRHRTKSWTTITTAPLSYDEFYSDNENNKKKLGDSGKDSIKKKIADTGFGDSEINDNKGDNVNIDKNTILQNDMNKSKSPKNMKQVRSITHSSSQSDINCDDETTDLFKKDPRNNIHTIVLVEDSDSNSVQVNIQTEDQCVPVVNPKLESKCDLTQYNLQLPFKSGNKNDSLKSRKDIANDTCEPMDVDETLSESLINNLPGENVLDNSQYSTNNSSISSKRKSSLKNISSSQTLEKSGKENKSTLILSQLKDLSTSENKLPVPFENKQLSNSSNTLNMSQENVEASNKQTPNYTSTPLQQKSYSGDSNKKSNLFHNISKHHDKVTVKEKITVSSNGLKSSSETSTSDEDSSSETKHELLVNEAEQANDSYESGDSQDEEEKQYEKDNEIVEKGETLTSDDDLSNDSNYEKDSFLVSSDEEDNELLSGSGDDLSLSDNELKMTTASKKKYNERKIKQQKQASREMFESRHCSNNSSNVNKSKLKKNSRQKLESSQSEEDIVSPKKKNRMRLNSSTNESIIKSDEEILIAAKNKNETNLLETSNNILSKKEIFICEEIPLNSSNHLVTSKKEQKTPKKESRCSVGFVDTKHVNDTANADTTSNVKSKDPLENSYEEDSSSTNSEDMNITQNYNNLLEELKMRTEEPNDSIVNKLTLAETKVINKSKDNIPIISEDSTDSSLENENVKEDVTNNHSFQDVFTSESNKTKKTKIGNHSLNFEKKPKKSDNHSIVDTLNITQVKESSRKNKTKTNKSNKTKEDTKDKVDDSSDSIDFNLLFSEDSGDSNKEIKENITSVENITPLKKTAAKTNILINDDAGIGKEESLPFFVDTMGNHCNENVENIDSSSSNNSESDESPREISTKKHNSTNEKEDRKTPEVKNKKITRTPVGQNISQVENTHKKSVNEMLASDVKRRKLTSESFNVSSLEVLFSQDNEIKDSKEKSLNMSVDKENPLKLLELNKLNPENIEAEELIKDSVNKKPCNSEKKKKSLSDSLNRSSSSKIEKAPISEKKKKGKLSQSFNKSQLDSSSCKAKEIVEHKSDLNTEYEAATSKSVNESMKVKEFSGEGETTVSIDSKKRKRKSSGTKSLEISSEGEINQSKTSNDAFGIFKKQKLLQNSQKFVESIMDLNTVPKFNLNDSNYNDQDGNTSQNKIKNLLPKKQSKDSQLKKNEKELDVQNTKTKCEDVSVAVSEYKKLKIKKNLKRKKRDDDEVPNKTLKVLKENSLDQIHISRLSTSVLNNLEDKPNKPKQKPIATTEFKVDETKKRKNKPSNYLEESIYINNDHEEAKKHKSFIKNPKVLPFIPTATISSSGYTTNFKVNVLSQTTNFVAQSSNVANFKNDYLYGKKIKRQGTYDLYKKNRKVKMSKF